MGLIMHEFVPAKLANSLLHLYFSKQYIYYIFLKI